MTPEWITTIVVIVSVVISAITLHVSIGKKISDRSKWEGEINIKCENFKAFMIETKSEFREINSKLWDMNGYIVKLISHIPKETSNKKSPKKLNTLGKKVKKELDPVIVAAWVNKAADNLRDEAMGKEPYLVQMLSFEYVYRDRNYTSDELRWIYKVAYKEGIIDLDVQTVLGLELRDKLLEMTAK